MSLRKQLCDTSVDWLLLLLLLLLLLFSLAKMGSPRHALVVVSVPVVIVVPVVAALPPTKASAAAVVVAMPVPVTVPSLPLSSSVILAVTSVASAAAASLVAAIMLLVLHHRRDAERELEDLPHLLADAPERFVVAAVAVPKRDDVLVVAHGENGAANVVLKLLADHGQQQGLPVSVSHSLPNTNDPLPALLVCLVLPGRRDPAAEDVQVTCRRELVCPANV